MPKQPAAAKMKAKATMASKKRKVTLTSDDTSFERSIQVATDSTDQFLTSGSQEETIDSTVGSSDSEGGTIDSIDINSIVCRKDEKPRVTPTKFPLFPRLPAEIQQMIFMEAMRKPAVHFAEIRYSQDGLLRWTISVHPVNGSADTSMYRQLRCIGSVCPAAARAVHFGTEDKHRLPFSARGLKSAGVDTRHDLVVFQLKATGARYDASDWGPWYPANFAASNCVLDVAHVRAMFSGITRIALKLDISLRRSSCFQWWLPFRSRLRIEDHRRFPMCPEELSGFLDLFPDLSNVYWLLAGCRTTEYKDFVRVYTRSFYELGPKRRESMGLSIFHDSKDAYLQFDEVLAAGETGHRLTTDLEDFNNFVKEALTADRHPTDPIPVRFQSSFEQRAGIKFAGLLKADPDWLDPTQ